ncbi:unnamed protein product [Pylaiella littoralis]
MPNSVPIPSGAVLQLRQDDHPQTAGCSPYKIRNFPTILLSVMTMADQHMGDTVKLVGAMMRLRHNTKFKGGGPGLDEAAPSSAASPAEHLDFIRLFCSQMRQRQEEGEAEPQRDAKITGDEDMLAANFAEAQIRALVNTELEACLVLHESKEFWQQRLDRSGSNLLNWIEMGPWTWVTHSRRDCCEYYLGSLSRCKHLLRNKILSAGSLQLHLTQMKQAYIEGTLNEWTAAAVPMIRRTLTAFADGTTRGGSSSSSGSNNITSRSHHSLASALTSKDCSPRNRRSRSGGDDGADESRRPRHAGSQSGLWRVTKAARGGGEGGASDQAEGGQQLGQEGGGGGGGGRGRGGRRNDCFQNQRRQDFEQQ